MAEHEHSNPIAEKEKWLASLEERGISVSEEEMALLETGTYLGETLAHFINLQAQYTDFAGKRVAEIGEEEPILRSEVESTQSEYNILLTSAQDPRHITHGEITPEAILQTARALESVQTRLELLKNEPDKIKVNLDELFPTVRSLLVELARSTPKFVSEVTPSVEPERDKDGLRALLDTAHQILPEVVSAIGPNLTPTPIQIETEGKEKKKERVKTRVQKERPVKEGEFIFNSWEEVFGIENLRQLKEEDSNFVLKYRWAIEAVKNKFPKRFAKYKNPSGNKSEYNWVGAIEPVLDLTVGELNEAINPKKSRTPDSTARILALVKRGKAYIDNDDTYTHHDKLLDLANKVRGGQIDPETQLIDLFEPAEKEGKTTDIQVTGVSSVDVYTASKTLHRDAKESKNDAAEKEKITGSVASILIKIHKQQTPEVQFGFPGKSMTQPQIAKLIRADGNTIGSEFIMNMQFKLKLVSPHGDFTSDDHPRYTECDIVQLYILKTMNIAGRTKSIQRLMETVEQVYPEARKRFEKQLEEEKRKIKR